MRRNCREHHWQNRTNCPGRTHRRRCSDFCIASTLETSSVFLTPPRNGESPLASVKCRTSCEKRSSGHTWQATCTQLLVTAAHTLGMAHCDSHSCSPQAVHWNLSHLTFLSLCSVLWTETSLYLSWLTDNRNWHERYQLTRDQHLTIPMCF